MKRRIDAISAWPDTRIQGTNMAWLAQRIVSQLATGDVEDPVAMARLMADGMESMGLNKISVAEAEQAAD